jgi:hypothetical protein
MDQVLQVGLIQYTYKVTLAILLTPIIYLAHWVIDGYLEKGKNQYQRID